MSLSKKDVYKSIQQRKREREFKRNFSNPSKPPLTSGQLFKNSVGVKDKLHQLSPKNKRKDAWKESILLRMLIASLIFLLIAFSYRSPKGYSFQVKVKKATKYTFSHDFNFAKSKSMFEKYFGSPEVALLSGETAKKSTSSKTSDVMVSGRVLEYYSDKNKGMVIGTALNTKVTSNISGVVLSVGKKNDLGTTVVVQSEDGTEFWYGMLAEAKVSQYQSVSKQDVLGVVSTTKDKKMGNYYLGVKKGEAFIDPNKVIRVE